MSSREKAKENDPHLPSIVLGGTCSHCYQETAFSGLFRDVKNQTKWEASGVAAVHGKVSNWFSFFSIISCIVQCSDSKKEGGRCVRVYDVVASMCLAGGRCLTLMGDLSAIERNNACFFPSSFSMGVVTNQQCVHNAVGLWNVMPCLYLCVAVLGGLRLQLFSWHGR